MNAEKYNELLKIVAAFSMSQEVKSIEEYGNGHINDTYLVTCDTRRYILQHMNKNIFLKPDELMENIVHVTSHLKTKIEQAGGDPERETLNVILTKDNGHYHVDESGEYWRTYTFIENANCLDAVSCPEDFYESAKAFGHFQYLLADFPADTLHVTIDRFHDTANRLENLRTAINNDSCGRVSSVQKEIRFALDREKDAHILGNMLMNGELPLRVTHNDTKLNNVMLDKVTGKGICVIDLDTVMPGLAINDFGDSIRFGASTAAEDERNLDKVSCDLNLYEAYVKGFIEGCQGSLTQNELNMMPMAAKMMTYECGVRFLTDYLEGDHYFKIHREGQNLDRCRTQFKLVKDMEAKMADMMEIFRKI